MQYTPMKCFNNLVHSAVSAEREGDENITSSVVTETMKLLADRLYGNQITDRGRYTVTRYLSDEKNTLSNQ